MIRTDAVNLTSIKGIAYRQKLPSGGSGIVIVRSNMAQPGIASISKTSGEAIPTANTSLKLFPREAFEEAMALTAGLPYRRQGKVQLKGRKTAEAAVSEEWAEEEVIVDSEEYEAIVEKYTDKSGKLSYDLLNKDMIKFAYSSSRVRKMIDEGESVEDICLYVVSTKFRNVVGNPDLTDAQIRKMIELLDAVRPKGVFKDFNNEIRKKKIGR